MPITDERASARYPVLLQLCYKAISNRGLVLGFGQTRMMSSQDIVFAPGDGLEPGMNAGIVVAWPPLIDGRNLLELVLEVSITDTQDGVAEARLLAYDIRTAGPPEAKQRAEAAALASGIDIVGSSRRSSLGG